jgi:hypothetical protein
MIFPIFYYITFQLLINFNDMLLRSTLLLLFGTSVRHLSLSLSLVRMRASERNDLLSMMLFVIILSNGGGNANIKRINYAIKMISRCAVIKSCLQLYTHISRRCTLILDGCKVKDYTTHTHKFHMRATPTKVRFILINHYITSYRFSSRFHAHGFSIPFLPPLFLSLSLLFIIIIIISIRFLFHRTHKHELL